MVLSRAKSIMEIKYTEVVQVLEPTLQKVDTHKVIQTL